MDENQSEQEKTKVGFPDASEAKKSGNGRVVTLVVIILLILGGATWYLFSRKEETIEFTNDAATLTPPQETPTPETVSEVDKSSLKLQIQNGTGTPGDAGKLETALNDLGYSGTSTGNAANYAYTSCEVTFSDSFPENYKKEIMDKLNSMYSSVKQGSLGVGNFDAILITGKAKSASGVKSTATPSPKVSQTVTPSPKVSQTVTPTLTPTP